MFDLRLLAPIATCIGIVVSVALWLLNQRRKELSYRIVKRQKILNLKGEAKKHLKVLFNDSVVDNAHVVLLRLYNSGHLTINPGEIQSNIYISTLAGSKILTASVTETNPADLDDRLPKKAESSFIESITDNRLTLKPLMLNQGDSLSLQLIVQDLVGEITIGGHIQGITQIREKKDTQILPTALIQIGAIIMAGSMLGVSYSSFFPFQLDDLLPSLLLLLIGYVILFAGMFMPRFDETSIGKSR